MKKIFTLFTILCMAGVMQAQLQFIEYFEDYADGDDLQTSSTLSETEWYLCLKADYQGGTESSSPIISSTPLTYTDYIASGVGKSVVLSSADADDDRITTRRVYNEAITDKLYAAFLVNVESAKTSLNDFFTWESSTSSNFARGRVYVSATEGDVTFGISKNSSTVNSVSGYALNTTYLMVLEYDKVGSEDDGNDDVVRIYINPDMSLTSTENTSIANTDTNTDYDSGNTTLAINLRQNKVGVTISGIRVSTNWEGLWSGTTGILDSPSYDELSLLVYDNYITNNETQAGQLTMYNLAGNTCLNQTIDASETITVNLAKGVYVVKFKGNDGSVKTTKAFIR
jgi:hypothetical protein